MLTNGVWTYTWNGENRLIVAEKSDQKLEFAYDYQGRRVSKKVYTGSTGNWTLASEKKFVYDGYLQIAEYDASNVLQRSYTWLGGSPGWIKDGANYYYYIIDGNKNVRSMVDASGNEVASYDYNPFGRVVLKTGTYADTNKYRFSSEYHDDETGLVYYNYRYYSPGLGRWINRDPIEEEGGANLYGMVDNDPINDFDLLGLLSLQQALSDGKVTYSELDKLTFSPHELKAILSLAGYKVLSKNSLSQNLRELADQEFAAFGSSKRYAIYSNYLNYKRARWIAYLRSHKASFRDYVEGLYKTTRVIMPVWYVSEVGYSVGSGKEPILGNKVNRYQTFCELTVYIGLIGVTNQILTNLHNNALYSDTNVTRWGSSGLKNNDWIMIGDKNIKNYILTFKWQPGGGNEFACYKTGQTFSNIPKNNISWPQGWGRDGWWKGLFGHRIYNGPKIYVKK
jgi:RHS repeat-associated protein